MKDGIKIYNLADQLFPIHRHLTGNGVRKTLKLIKKIIPQLSIYEVPSGTKCFDWKIPLEWSISKAYIKDENNKIIVDIKDNNLNVVQYSNRINKKMSYADLKNHLHYIKELPNAIPYVTSYYKKNWGFCLPYNKFKKLDKKSNYKVLIDSKLFSGSLTYGELIIPGRSKKEVFLSSYICHPSLANNEISGPSLLTFLTKYILSLKNKFYTYRIIFIPETIGSLYYLSKNFNLMQKNTILGINISCVGDDGPFSLVQTRNGNTYTDNFIIDLLKTKKNFKIYNFFKHRGSDERQYSHPKIDLPIATFTRSKFGTYKEYHNSLDNMNFITKKGFQTSYNFLKKIVSLNEKNIIYENNTVGEPFLTKYNLIHEINKPMMSISFSKVLRDVLFCIDGKTDLKTIQRNLKINREKLLKIIKILKKHKFIK